MKFATLTCKRDLSIAIQCLGSLIRYCTDAMSIDVFEDGSFSDADADALLAALPSVRLIRRPAMDQSVSDYLERYPRCRSFRRDNALALKLLDFPLLSEPGVVFVDSDLRFFRPFRCEAVAAAQRRVFIFMEDPTEGYSGRLLDLRLKHGLRMASRVNTGFLHIPQSRHDLDFIEWFLGVPEFRIFPNLVEQTCLAAMAGTRDVLFVDSQQIRCSVANREVESSTIAVHFIFDQRSKLAGLTDLPENDSKPVQDLRLVLPPALTIGRILARSLARRVQRFPS